MKTKALALLAALMVLVLPLVVLAGAARADDTVLNVTNLVTGTTSTSLDLSGGAAKAWSLEAVVTDQTPSAIVIASGVAEVDQITFDTMANTGDGDYFVINDYTGASWAVALDTTGAASNTPTGAAWVAVPSGHKVYTDISSATTGSDVSGLVHTAINALTGFTAVVTCSTSTTHQNCTDAWAGVVTAPTVYSKAGASGTGSITKSVTTPGTAAGFAATGNTATKTSHGMVTGVKGQFTTSSSLPLPLLTSTDYWTIKVDTDTLKFATSLANSLTGTAVAITGYGVGNQTFTPTALSAAVKTQHSIDCQNFVDITSGSQNVTATGALVWAGTDDAYDCVRAVWTHTAGEASALLRYRVKNYGAP